MSSSTLPPSLAEAHDVALDGETESSHALLVELRKRGADAFALAAAAMDRAQTLATVRESKGKEHLPVCQPGCSWCCIGIRVGVTAPEALLIAESLRRDCSPEELDELKQHVGAAADRSHGLSVDEYAEQQLRCPFLDAPSGECAVYDVRPMACRAHASFDAQACKRACENPTSLSTVPLDALSSLIFEPCRLGLRAAIGREGLDDRLLELSQAVRIALERPDAGAAWLGGARIFEQASVEHLRAAEVASLAAKMARGARNARKRMRRQRGR